MSCSGMLRQPTKTLVEKEKIQKQCWDAAYPCHLRSCLLAECTYLLAAKSPAATVVSSSPSPSRARVAWHLTEKIITSWKIILKYQNKGISESEPSVVPASWTWKAPEKEQKQECTDGFYRFNISAACWNRVETVTTAMLLIQTDESQLAWRKLVADTCRSKYFFLIVYVEETGDQSRLSMQYPVVKRCRNSSALFSQSNRMKDNLSSFQNLSWPLQVFHQAKLTLVFVIPESDVLKDNSSNFPRTRFCLSRGNGIFIPVDDVLQWCETMTLVSWMMMHHKKVEVTALEKDTALYRAPSWVRVT